MFDVLNQLSRADILFSVFLLSLPLGSFYNVVALRTLSGESYMSSKERSYCNSCGHQLHWNDLIPVISWLSLKGKCRYCGAKIPGMYSLWEFFTALFYTFIVYRFGFTIETLIQLILITIMIWSAVTDYQEQRIPKQFLTAGFILIGLLGFYANGYLFGIRIGLSVLGVLISAVLFRLFKDPTPSHLQMLIGLLILSSSVLFTAFSLLLSILFKLVRRLGNTPTKVSYFVPYLAWAVLLVLIISSLIT